MDKKYSVIIPTYNYGHYLPQSLGSALNQTVPPLEIIVIDGGSTDDTADVIKPYLNDARIRTGSMPQMPITVLTIRDF